MIHCPKCHAETQVTETRDAGNYTRRRRVCSSVCCGQRVTTVEMIANVSGDNHRTVHDAMMIPRADVEAIFQIVADALIARLGRQAVISLLDDPLPIAQAADEPDTTTGTPPLPEGTAP